MKILLRWWQRWATRRELRELSDYQLKDLGLSRGQIESLYR